MSLDVDPRTRPLPELDLEQEVDFGRYARLIGARWWLLVVGAIVGAVIGLSVATTRSRPVSARVIVYLGQPYLNGVPVQNLNTKMAFLGQLLVQRSTLAEISKKTGVRPGKLAAAVSAETVTGLTRGKNELPAPLVAVSVDKLPAKLAAAAANAYGDLLARYFSSYVDTKMKTYQIRLKRLDKRITDTQAVIDSAQGQEKAVVANHSLPESEKLLLLAHFDNVINANTTRLNGLEADQISSGDVITFADQVERARVLEPAQLHRAAPLSRRTSVLVGAFAGLLVGLIAALFWDPVVGRLRNQREATA